MTKSDLIDIEVVLLRETEKAWQVNFGGKRSWVSKSQAELEKNLNGRTWTLTTSGLNGWLWRKE